MSTETLNVVNTVGTLYVDLSKQRHTYIEIQKGKEETTELKKLIHFVIEPRFLVFDMFSLYHMSLFMVKEG